MSENEAIREHESGGNLASADDADDTVSDHRKLPHRMLNQPEVHKADRLTFFGFAPLRKRLSGDALDVLLDHRQWAKPEDPPEVVGKKNVIMMFTIHAEIEDCLVQIPFGDKVDAAKPLGLLQQLLGINMKGPRAYTFSLAILKAYSNSRHEQILQHLLRDEWPPEPEAPMDKVLLSVVDKRIVFKFTRTPLHTMLVPMSVSRLQHHRLKLERLLSNEIEVEKVFAEFKPMVPEMEQKEWPRPWQIQDWLWQQERMCKKRFKLPKITTASSDTKLTADTNIILTKAKGNDINAHTSDKSSTRPNGSKVRGGLCLYTLAIRLACNFVSSDPAPGVVQNFAKVIFDMIVKFAAFLEGWLKYQQPNSTGQFHTTDQNDSAAVTLVISPVEIRDILDSGIEMVKVGLISEDLVPSLWQWSWIATEVQQGKVAFKNACEESLARRLPHGFSLFGVFE